MQWYELLTQDQAEQIHETSLQILEQIGVDFTYPPALEVLSKGGAKVDGKRVFFSRRLKRTAGSASATPTASGWAVSPWNPSARHPTASTRAR